MEPGPTRGNFCSARSARRHVSVQSRSGVALSCECVLSCRCTPRAVHCQGAVRDRLCWNSRAASAVAACSSLSASDQSAVRNSLIYSCSGSLSPGSSSTSECARAWRGVGGACFERRRTPSRGSSRGLVITLPACRVRDHRDPRCRGPCPSQTAVAVLCPAVGRLAPMP